MQHILSVIVKLFRFFLDERLCQINKRIPKMVECNLMEEENERERNEVEKSNISAVNAVPNHKTSIRTMKHGFLILGSFFHLCRSVRSCAELFMLTYGPHTIHSFVYSFIHPNGFYVSIEVFLTWNPNGVLSKRRYFTSGGAAYTHSLALINVMVNNDKSHNVATIFSVKWKKNEKKMNFVIQFKHLLLNFKKSSTR